MCGQQTVSVVTIVIHTPFAMTGNECRYGRSVDQCLHCYGDFRLARMDMAVIINPQDSLAPVVSAEDAHKSAALCTDVIHCPYLLLRHVGGSVLTAPAIDGMNEFVRRLILVVIPFIPVVAVIFAVVIDIFLLDVRFETQVFLETCKVAVLVARLCVNPCFIQNVGIGRNGKTVGDLRHYILAVFCQCVALGLRSIIVFDELRTRTEDSQTEYDDKYQ